MRKSFITFLACLSLIVAVASCTTSKQTAITRLERFSYELRDNGQYYSFKDWERAADEFTKIRKTIGKHDLTGDERHYIGELEGQCAGYVYNGRLALRLGAHISTKAEVLPTYASVGASFLSENFDIGAAYLTAANSFALSVKIRL